ncbi:Uncharacterized protein FWK35_00038089 [Aphis craccivora]|uniref:Secreted protein n=1 Tax=Aphis craccivora TaxID=307492 RepID=A0A6G0VQF9_APHCR|nr:Uncharacterized protein FWK35_00038089 [Aphis craccivora]
MMCVFFVFCVCVQHNYSRNNALVLNFGGGFRWQNEYSWCIIGKLPTIFKKIEKNGKFFTQNQFSTKSIFLYGCNTKTNHCKYLKFSQNVYISVIYIQSNFQNILTF